jgi:carbamoyl-phosphate synthase small subunit
MGRQHNVRTDATKLLLNDGVEFSGHSFGAQRIVGGEVVFNTGMTGYVETLTDPSYAGQILVLTYPLIGNYGVPAGKPDEALARPFESRRIQVQGLVVQNYVAAYSHHSATRSLHAWLLDEEIPAIAGVDTRALTRHLRSIGTMQGWMYPADIPADEARSCAETVDMRSEVFHRVAPLTVTTYGTGELTVLLVDAGAKDNLVRSLLERNVRVIRAPWHTDLEILARKAHGVLIGNGPGDPKDLAPLTGQVRELMAEGRKPIFGVCLGNQILALAAGGETYKLPYGHRSVNQPVQDLLTGRSYVTSQNHGYAVDDNSLPSDWEPWFINANDGTNEGIRSRTKPFFSVQFHPESHPGPSDTSFLFDDFVRLIGAMRA